MRDEWCCHRDALFIKSGREPIGSFPHKGPAWLRASVPDGRAGGREDQSHGSYLLQPLCPKELWHFVHQCYGNELGLTSDDEDYVPPDDDFNTMG